MPKTTVTKLCYINCGATEMTALDIMKSFRSFETLFLFIRKRKTSVARRVIATLKMTKNPPLPIC